MADVTLAMTFADGTIVRGVGFIDIEGWESESNKLTLGMFPKDNKWENFTGSGGDISGSIRKLTINGVTYRVLGDTNVTLKAAEYKNEAVPTSGGNLRKMMKQVRELTGVAIACNPTERETLRVIAEG